MVFNFLHPNLQPTIKCSSISDDLYPPENLISRDVEKQRLGFMAYPVTKPPVIFEFKLICPIVISSIKIWTRSGSFKSTAIVINGKADCTWYKIGQNWEIIGDGVIFMNPNASSTCNDPKFITTSLFRTNQLFKNIQTFQIIIERTDSVPVLKKIEIWGKPSRFCKKDVWLNVKKLWNETKIVEVSNSSEAETKIEEGEEDNSSLLQKANVNILEIPEEFLDQITYEIMTIPIVLPSGKVVDKYTLERHSKCNEKWGKSPSDPFTGIPLGDNKRAVLDSALKAKIDAFIIKFSEHPDIKNIPRTIASNLGKRARTPSVNPRFDKVLKYSSTTLPLEGLKLPQNDKKTDKMTATNEINTTSVKRPSLADAVQAALTNITRFTQHSTNSLKKIEDACGFCRVTEFLYRIKECNHFICRKCILCAGNSSFNCNCGVNFTSKDLKRYHSQ